MDETKDPGAGGSRTDAPAADAPATEAPAADAPEDDDPPAAGPGSERPVSTGGLSLADANVLRSGTRLKVQRGGMMRQDLEGESAEGRYVSQFESPVHGRMIVVHLPGRGNFGFRLDELRQVEV